MTAARAERIRQWMIVGLVQTLALVLLNERDKVKLNRSGEAVQTILANRNTFYRDALPNQYQPFPGHNPLRIRPHWKRSVSVSWPLAH